jgi:hypothetical protein
MVSFFTNTRRTTPAGFGTTLARNILITLAMTYLLNTSRTVFARTNTLIDRLITFTLSTNALTRCCFVRSQALPRSTNNPRQLGISIRGDHVHSLPNDDDLVPPILLWRPTYVVSRRHFHACN